MGTNRSTTPQSTNIQASSVKIPSWVEDSRDFAPLALFQIITMVKFLTERELWSLQQTTVNEHVQHVPAGLI